MKNLVYFLILVGLILMSKQTQAQYKDWGTKFGARYNMLLPQDEFPNVGFWTNDKFSFDHYTMSWLLEGFVGFELTPALEMDINAGYGSYAGFQFNYVGYHKSEIIPVSLRLRVAPFDLKGWNPYFYAGGGMLHYSNKYFELSNVTSPTEVKSEGWAGVFPLGIGTEIAISDEVLADISIGGAFTSTSALNNYDNGSALDNYYNIGVGLTFTGEGCSSDRDNDGLGKCEEEELGTSPRNPDTDGDGLTDGEEVRVYKTNPLLADTDLDGLSDFDEVKKYKTDPLKSDTDGDNLNDGEEVLKYKTDPLDTDTDKDGLKDGQEVIKYQTDPSKADTDGDGLNDGAEILTNLTNPLNKDTDGDELSDYDEVVTYKTNPLVKDTDGGTIADGVEVKRGTDPLDPSDDVIKTGVPIILDGITFATAKWDITPESENTLRKALKSLKTHPDIDVEISGHTDNVGSDASNQKLSERRANAVRDWLIREGINPDRLTAVGYGESQPTATNDTPEGRQKNRRIEFKRIK